MAEVRRVAVVGALGRMGERVRAALEEEATLRLGGALEASTCAALGERLAEGVCVEDEPKRALEGCQVAIDFSVPAAAMTALREAAEAGVAFVSGTTGISEAERAEMDALSRRVPLLHAPNFSVAVNVLAWLTREAAARLGAALYDAEIVELHHRAKRDAPSGTALRLAEAVAEGRGESAAERIVLERAGEIGARPTGAIGIQTLRGGDNPGEHTVLFLAGGERLELTHRAQTRDHFARGAVRAAAWLAGRAPGRYRIEQVLGLD